MADCNSAEVSMREFLGARVALLQDGFGSIPDFSDYWPGHRRGDLARVIDYAIAMNGDVFLRVEFEEVPRDVYDIDLQDLTMLFTVHEPGMPLDTLSAVR